MGLDFGKLLGKLRSERGMTQSDLAHRAGLHLSTIAKAEGLAQCNLRRSNARAIFAALTEASPLEPAAAAIFLEATGLAAGVALARQMMDSAAGRQAFAINQLLAVLTDPTERQAVRWFFELLDQVGAGSMLDAVRGLAAMSKVELTPEAPEETRDVTVVHPPIDKGSHTEQVYEHLRVKAGKSGAAHAPAKKRRAQ